MSGGDRIRLFCALRLAEPALDALVAWQRRHLPGGGEGVRLVPRANLHVTLAFLGSRPAGDVPAIAGVLREAAGAAGRVELAPERYRETRSVGMVVLSDLTGAATALAERVQAGLEREGLYRREQRAWLPHVTVARFRDRPRLGVTVEGMANVCPSDAAVMVSVPAPAGARYEVVETAVLGGR
ncbi:MAG TPA: 2'-5' RNA ligase family protein [Gaiellaceae bacterium]|nr:2'-5' RNA ligase family protein [Gaiellaceae bacterium]